MNSQRWVYRPAEQGSNEWVTSLTEGAIGGLVATLPMTVVMLVIHRLLPWTERYALEPQIITEKTARRLGISKGLEKRQRQTISTLAHFTFGAAAGAVFGPLAQRLPLPPVASGVLYGLAVWASSYAGWLPAFGILSPPDHQPKGRNVMLIAAHLTWGAVLGLMVQRRIDQPEAQRHESKVIHVSWERPGEAARRGATETQDA